MENDEFCITFWGVRGSLPVSGERYKNVGGNTACIHVRCGDDELVFDAGCGVRALGKAILERGVDKLQLFFSHSHYDHILGLPFSSRSSIRGSMSPSGPAISLDY